MKTEHLFFKRVLNRLGRPFGVNPFPRAFPNPITERSSSAAAVFDEIHRANFWGSGESHSGVGSELVLHSNLLANGLRPPALRIMGYGRLFDAPSRRSELDVGVPVRTSSSPTKAATSRPR